MEWSARRGSRPRSPRSPPGSAWRSRTRNRSSWRGGSSPPRGARGGGGASPPTPSTPPRCQASPARAPPRRRGGCWPPRGGRSPPPPPPARVPDAGPRRFDPVAAGSLTFEAVHAETYPAYGLGRAAAASGGTAPAAFNAANEVAVELFLEGSMRFGRIAETIARVLDAWRPADAGTLDAVLDADAEARRRAREVACS